MTCVSSIELRYRLHKQNKYVEADNKTRVKTLDIEIQITSHMSKQHIFRYRLHDLHKQEDVKKQII